MAFLLASILPWVKFFCGYDLFQQLCYVWQGRYSAL
mgnify:CR=1 FL=1